MKILLVSSTQLEIQSYVLGAPHHDILITGVGLHAATYELTHQLQGHRYDLVVQAGVAGAFSGRGYKMGDVVAVAQDAFGDAGSYENGQLHSLQQLGLSTDKEWLVNKHDILHRFEVPKVRAITVNTITNDAAYLQALQQKWEADIESMEGAALHYVCGKRGVPYLQLRAISNMVGERDKNKWLLATAIGNLNNALQVMMQQLQHSMA